MSEQLYMLQTLLVGGVVLTLFRTHPRLIQLQIVVWTLGVTGIAWRYGLVEQLNFYSNDQRYYQDVVERLLAETTFVSEAFSLEGMKLPFTGPALILAFAGIHPALALKTISLVSLLTLTSSVLQRYGEQALIRQSRVLYLTGSGGIGVFFSMLALRETMMMLFVYRYATAMSPVSRVISLVVVYLLRPHLAVALAVGECMVTMWRWLSRRDSIGYIAMLIFTAMSVVIGASLFAAQANLLQGGDTSQDGFLGISQITRVASNFVGLQFLTVPEGTVNFSISSLLLLRIALSETILIPIGFSISCLLFAHRLRWHHLFTLSAFAIYVSVATKTDFNSFRQNIPFMPLLGIVILDIVGVQSVHSATTGRQSRDTASLRLDPSAGPKRQIEPTSTG